MMETTKIRYLALRPVLIGMAGLCAMAGGTSAQADPSAQAATVIHAEGIYGSFFFSGSNIGNGYLSVFRIVEGSTGGTSIMFQGSKFLGPSSFQVWFGQGRIPDSDLTGEGTGNLRLKADSVNMITCTVVFPLSGPPPCTVIPGGTIDITWQQVPGSVQHQTFNNTEDNGVWTIHKVGESNYRLATASGTFFGNVVAPDTMGQIGQYHNITITVTQDQ
jgi:hypothetical protein